MGKPLQKRKPMRLRHYDYNTPGAYFITICTKDRKMLLSRIVGGDVPDAPDIVQLLPYGKIAEKYLRQLDDFYGNISIKYYVIMPNHIHALLVLQSCDSSNDTNGAPRTSPPTTKQHSTLSSFVSTFKRFCNKEYGENIWQRYFFDHIIKNENDYLAHIRYILENPLRWHLDELYSKE